MTAQKEKASFLRAICEQPDENSVRLVYADWLDEHGEADRAAFIRSQCAGCPLTYNLQRYVDKRFLWAADDVGRWVYEAAGNVTPDHPRFGSYSWCEEKDGSVWTKTGHQTYPTEGVRLVYTRGFISRIELTREVFLKEGFAKQLFSSYPLTRVVLTDRAPERVAGLSTWYKGWGLINRDWPSPHHLGRELWELLPEWTVVPSYKKLKGYRSEQSALNALSQACVAFGRHKANLPPLTE